MKRIEDMGRRATMELDAAGAFKTLLMTISSGTGDNRMRHAVAIRAFESIGQEHPSLLAVRNGMNLLVHWAQEHYPERSDWTVVWEACTIFPPGCEVEDKE